MRSSQLFIPFFVLAVALSIAPVMMPAHAEAPAQNTTIHPVVSGHLTDFKSTVFEMRREADRLNSFVPGSRISWETHIRSLNALSEHVNDLGRTLARLEELRPDSGETQQMAIENARPHLVAAAQNLTQAIEMVNENRRSIIRTDYVEAVRNIYEHADSLYQKVDTILDYEATRTRLDDLELQPNSNEGS